MAARLGREAAAATQLQGHAGIRSPPSCKLSCCHRLAWLRTDSSSSFLCSGCSSQTWRPGLRARQQLQPSYSVMLSSEVHLIASSVAATGWHGFGLTPALPVLWLQQPDVAARLAREAAAAGQPDYRTLLSSNATSTSFTASCIRLAHGFGFTTACPVQWLQQPDVAARLAREAAAAGQPGYQIVPASEAAAEDLQRTAQTHPDMEPLDYARILLTSAQSCHKDSGLYCQQAGSAALHVHTPSWSCRL